MASNTYSFANARVIVFDPEVQTRTLTVSHLRAMGFGKIIDVDTAESLIRATQTESCDLLICEASEEICDFVVRIRRYALRTDPFLPILLTAWEPTGQLVSQAVNAGVDGLLMKPFSIGLLMDRINAIIESRRGFVRAGGYLGPDRRGGQNRKSEEILVEVPNGLKAKVTSSGIAPTRENIISTIKHLQEVRITRNALQIRNLTARAVQVLNEGNPFNKQRNATHEQLQYVVGDMIAVARECNLKNLEELTQGLESLVQSVFHTHPDQVASRHMTLMHETAAAIFAAANERVTRDNGPNRQAPEAAAG